MSGARGDILGACLGGGAFKNGTRLAIGEPPPVARIGGPQSHDRRAAAGDAPAR